MEALFNIEDEELILAEITLYLEEHQKKDSCNAESIDWRGRPHVHLR
jgi:hypothetical protein